MYDVDVSWKYIYMYIYIKLEEQLPLNVLKNKNGIKKSENLGKIKDFIGT